DFKQYRHITSGPEFERARSQFSAARVATAIAFLRQCRPIKTPSLCSYGLKHAAESWGERNGLEGYVANGELIAAAVYLGLTLKPFEYDCPNVKIGISRKDVRRLRRRR